MLIGDSVSEVGTRYADVDEAIKRFTNRDVSRAGNFSNRRNERTQVLPPVDLLLAKMYFLTQQRSGRPRLAGKNGHGESRTIPKRYLILADQAMQQGRTIEAEALYDKGLRLTENFRATPSGSGISRSAPAPVVRASPSGGRIGTPPSPICRRC